MKIITGCFFLFLWVIGDWRWSYVDPRWCYGDPRWSYGDPRLCYGDQRRCCGDQRWCPGDCHLFESGHFSGFQKEMLLTSHLSPQPTNMRIPILVIELCIFKRISIPSFENPNYEHAYDALCQVSSDSPFTFFLSEKELLY